MKISGIMKLRLVVTVLFVIMMWALVISFLVSNNEMDAYDEFYNGLSPDEFGDLENVFSKYPIKDYTSEYAVAGWLMYIVAVGLFFLMVRVWRVDNIY